MRPQHWIPRACCAHVSAVVDDRRFGPPPDQFAVADSRQNSPMRFKVTDGCLGHRGSQMMHGRAKEQVLSADRQRRVGRFHFAFALFRRAVIFEGIAFRARGGVAVGDRPRWDA